MKPIKTWVVVADGARARIVLNRGPGKGFEALNDMIFQAPHPPTKEIMTDKPGRTFESVGRLRHAKQPRSDAHQNLKEDFTRMLAKTLERHADDYDRIILVAPPPTLGSLRQSIPKRIADKIHGELAKDLTHTPNTELGNHLKDLIAA